MIHHFLLCLSDCEMSIFRNHANVAFFTSLARRGSGFSCLEPLEKLREWQWDFWTRVYKDNLGVLWGFPAGASGKKLCLPVQETQEASVWSLGWEDPLWESMETHSSILAWKIPCTVEPGGLQSTRVQRVRPNWAPYVFYLKPERRLYQLESDQVTYNKETKITVFLKNRNLFSF